MRYSEDVMTVGDSRQNISICAGLRKGHQPSAISRQPAVGCRLSADG